MEGEVDPPDPNLSVWTDRMSRMRHLWELITTYQDRAFTKQAKYYDRRHRDLQFKVGDLVKKPNNVLSSTKDKIASKLAPKFTGPYVVVEVVSPNVYTLASQDGRLAGRYHASHLQRFIEDNEEGEVDPNNPDEIDRQRQLDRELLEIHDTDSETDLLGNSNPEVNIDFGYENRTNQNEIGPEPPRRMRLRHRSYSG